MFFQCTKPPFNNMKVRQAFAHAVDRNSIIKALLAPLAVPAYGYLMPGYPFAVSQPLEKYTNYDPAMAQKLLAEAGFPKGKGFPDDHVQLPSQPERPRTRHWRSSSCRRCADGWNTTLFGGNSTLLAAELDTTTFYQQDGGQAGTQIQMGFVSYGMDYFDASNMLSVYKSERGGRHDWNNAQYDNLLAQGAAAFNTAKRQEIYTEAQTLLTQRRPQCSSSTAWTATSCGLTSQGRRWPRTTSAIHGLEWPRFATSSLTRRGSTSANNVHHYPRSRKRVVSSASPLAASVMFVRPA